VKPPILVFVSFGIALATASANASTTPEPHHLQPNAPRSVTVTEAETPPVIRAGLLQSTLILLPAEEKIATVFGGDTVDFGGAAGLTSNATSTVGALIGGAAIKGAGA
jgi:hypothetical protein